MGIGPEAVLRMPLHDYEAAIFHWNRQHETGDEESEALDADDFAAMMDDARARGVAAVH